MEKMLVVVFDDESKAYEGSHALHQLDAEGNIAIHGEAVIKKNTDGTITVKQSEDDFPLRTLGGTAIGSLIGLLEGPIGLGIGAVAGAFAGSIGDLNVAGVNAEFLDEASAALARGKCAVVADVSEEWVTPVDTRMELLGGVVLRTPRSAVEDEQRAKEVATLRVEIAQLKAEYAQARANRKAKLQARIDTLNAKLDAKLERAEQRSKQIRTETEAKVEALQQKAAKAQGDIKATFDARVKGIQEDYEQSVTKTKQLLAGQLREAAAHLEK
ncbi:MAG: DUF1269 domain-containing protein [Bryobacteraceae bacterium]